MQKKLQGSKISRHGNTRISLKLSAISVITFIIFRIPRMHTPTWVCIWIVSAHFTSIMPIPFGFSAVQFPDVIRIFLKICNKPTYVYTLFNMRLYNWIRDEASKRYVLKNKLFRISVWQSSPCSPAILYLIAFQPSFLSQNQNLNFLHTLLRWRE